MSATSWPSTHQSEIPPVDSEGWNKFVSKYRPHMVRYCRGFGLDEHAAEDAAQVVLTRLVRIMPTFAYDPEKGSLRGFLKTAIRHAVYDVYKIERKFRIVIEALRERLTEEQAEKLVDDFSNEWRRAVLAEAMTHVKKRFRSVKNFEAFRLRAIEGISAKRVAERLEMSPEAVDKAKSRGEEFLREEVNAILGQASSE